MAGPQRLPRTPKVYKKKGLDADATRKISYHKFNSISHFSDCVHALDMDCVWGGPHSGNSSLTTKESYKWCDHTSLADALTIGRNGGYWAEGAKSLQQVQIAQGALDEVMVRPAYELSLVGGCVDVGEYLAGNPECMVGLVDEAETLPVITITYISTIRADITADQKMNYGRAILALVDSLEQQGYSIELVAQLSFIDGDGKYAEGCAADVVVKQAGEQWNASAIAYSIAHPAFSRRIGFRYAEAIREAEKVTSGGYGRGKGVNLTKGGVFLPYLTKGDKVSTPERALRYVVDLAKQQKPELFV